MSPADPAKPSLTWYQHVWLGLPFLLVLVGGLIGGLCGGAAWGINQAVFQKIQHPVLRYVLTGLITVAAFVVYSVVVIAFLAMLQ